MTLSTKILLGLIAAGLWANAIASYVRPAQAQTDYSLYLGEIARDVRALANGGRGCRNTKICD